MVLDWKKMDNPLQLGGMPLPLVEEFLRHIVLFETFFAKVKCDWRHMDQSSISQVRSIHVPTLTYGHES